MKMLCFGGRRGCDKASENVSAPDEQKVEVTMTFFRSIILRRRLHTFALREGIKLNGPCMSTAWCAMAFVC